MCALGKNLERKLQKKPGLKSEIVLRGNMLRNDYLENATQEGFFRERLPKSDPRENILE